MTSSSPGVSAVTQADIAAALGVSTSTVCRALKNDPIIPEEHRHRIQERAEKMGYRPNSLAVALSHWKQGSKTTVHSSLAWLNLWPNPTWPHSVGEFRKYWSGASEVAEKQGYHLEEFTVTRQMSLSRLEKVLVARGIVGVFIPPQLSSPDWSGFHWENFSVLRFGRSCATPESHLVTSDQVATTRVALQAIENRGYLRTGFVTAGWATRRGALVKAGVLLHQSDLPKNRQIPPLAFEETKAPWEHNYVKYVATLGSWLKKHQPEAVFTDVGELRKMLADAGYSVPEDVALASYSAFDGDADAGIDQNATEIGRVGALVMISMINAHDRGIPAVPREILIPGRWVDGSTLPRRC